MCIEGTVNVTRSKAVEQILRMAAEADKIYTALHHSGKFNAPIDSCLFYIEGELHAKRRRIKTGIGSVQREHQ